ncbi:Fungalysin metallopeptidase-domain-containing protein [Desarmillaria tabescens]|uniref:Extracellular metalloproteinase n=1 Tax=Armillaria tabescens TaxID=1929756 RepID=A0AA39U487_ARMTA|nr:Fungalysin metallopeptidase-domain-containing protein [Desarmillaria tabescens]KAK0470399.1 Fungalysin metallopeptidase-domain-containing protein [Desarmillaria tabescens]
MVEREGRKSVLAFFNGSEGRAEGRTPTKGKHCTTETPHPMPHLPLVITAILKKPLSKPANVQATMAFSVAGSQAGGNGAHCRSSSELPLLQRREAHIQFYAGMGDALIRSRFSLDIIQLVYIWTVTTPRRDGALQSAIVIHEFTHGITNHLTGGGTGRCLQTIEAARMGEICSDAMAEWTEHRDSAVPDYALATWVFNNPTGIRTHSYSTDASASIQTLHTKSTIVWANIHHNVYVALVQARGFSAKVVQDPSDPEGNIVRLHLFIDALPSRHVVLRVTIPC